MLEVETPRDFVNFIGQKVSVSDRLLIAQDLIERFSEVTFDLN